MQRLGSWNQFLKDLLHQFPWSTKCLTLHPNCLQSVLKVNSCRDTGFHLCCVGSVAKLCLTLCDPGTAGHQAPLSMEFSRQEHWSGLQWIFLTQVLNPHLLSWQADSSPPCHLGSPVSVEADGKCLLQAPICCWHYESENKKVWCSRFKKRSPCFSNNATVQGVFCPNQKTLLTSPHPMAPL